MDLNKLFIGIAVAIAGVPIGAQTFDDALNRYRQDQQIWEESNKRRQAQTTNYTAGNIQRIQYLESNQDVAIVVSRQPRYSTVFQQVCTQVPVERRGTGGTILGGVLGAALGNQIGDGRGRDIATAAGAVIGGSIGGQQDSYVEMQTRCTQQPSTVVSGETVTFEYRGRRFTQVFQ